MGFDKAFVCKNVMPGIGCNLPEMVTLGCAFLLAAIVSILLMIDNCRKSKSKVSILDQTVWFWIFLLIWCLYRGATLLVPFNWTLITFKICFVGLHHILLFIPMCLVILILFDLLFTYRNPGTNAIVFFRSLFILFLLTFITLGIVLSVVDLENESDPEESIALWCACTDLILAIFFVLPARSLLKAVTYPMVQPEDACCVNFCKVGILCYCAVFFIRMFYNGLHYFGWNPLQEWLNKELAKTPEIPTGGARAVTCCFWVLFDLVPSLFALSSVYLFKKHDMMFNENPYYTRQSD